MIKRLSIPVGSIKFGVKGGFSILGYHDRISQQLLGGIVLASKGFGAEVGFRTRIDLICNHESINGYSFVSIDFKDVGDSLLGIELMYQREILPDGRLLIYSWSYIDDNYYEMNKSSYHEFKMLDVNGDEVFLEFDNDGMITVR